LAQETRAVRATICKSVCSKRLKPLQPESAHALRTYATNKVSYAANHKRPDPAISQAGCSLVHASIAGMKGTFP